MKSQSRREFLQGSITAGVAGSALLGGGPLAAASEAQGAQADPGFPAGSRPRASASAGVRDLAKNPFRRLVILGESTVEGGPWLQRQEDRYADVLVRLINSCQEHPIEYYNKGIGANAISPRSPGYADSRKPSALERYKTDVIDLKPDLFILAYGLNDMRAAMPIPDFREDMATIIREVQKASDPVTVLTTVYYMTGWRSFPPYNQGSVPLTLQYNDCIRGLAEEYGCLLADVWQAEGGADWLIHYDGVHANKVGNLVIAHRIFEVLAQHSSGLTEMTMNQERDTDWTRKTTALRAQSGDPFKKTW